MSKTVSEKTFNGPAHLMAWLDHTNVDKFKAEMFQKHGACDAHVNLETMELIITLADEVILDPLVAILEKGEPNSIVYRAVVMDEPDVLVL